ncbi:hypothetical protein [Photobacterium leiognathi]|uniref:hypothetical protein n=1 Tax=Photobacterium leiognathi TaxID=553611 RepID=UPI0029816489|nr:hypothetical protein [Photobacterium leiognathi]
MKENKIIEDKNKKPFNQWKYGDLINGAKLTTVYIKKEELIVYKCLGDIRASWEAKVVLNDNRKHSFYKYSEYCNKIDSLDIYHSKVDLYECLNKIFAYCFSDQSLDNDLIDTKFSQIDTLIEKTKEQLGKIYATNKNYSIYLDNENNIRVRFSMERSEQDKALSDCVYKAKKLEVLSKKHLNKEQLPFALDQICIALCYAYKLKIMNIDFDTDSVFNDVECILNSQFTAKIRLQFMLGIITFSLLFAIIIYSIQFVNPEYSLYLKAMLLALSGSFISIVQRHNKLKITTSISPLTISIESLSRIIIGLIFGFICILLSKSGIALDSFNSNENALLIFSFISGFSERFIPNMLNEVSPK